MRLGTSAPRVVRNRLEADLQRKIIAECKTRGVFARKMESRGKRGFPDLLVIKEGRHIFIEMKRYANHKPKALQNFTHREMRRCGAEVITLRGRDATEGFLQELFEDYRP